MSRASQQAKVINIVQILWARLRSNRGDFPKASLRFFRKTNFASHSLDVAALRLSPESKEPWRLQPADSLSFHLLKAVKERTVSCYGRELAQLNTVRATFFFLRVRPLSVFFPFSLTF